MKAREYCIGLGLAKPGKGKLSFAAHAAIKAAIDGGQTFEDYAEGKVVKPSGTNRSSNKSLSASVLSGDVSGEPGRISSGQSEGARPKEIKSNPKTHDYNTVWGICTKGRSNLPIAFQYCAKCLRQVTYCSHAVPQLPDWVGGGDALIVRPIV